MNNECPICLDLINNKSKIIKLNCNHTFHVDCVKKIRSNQCPLCRSEIEFKNKFICSEKKAFHYGFGYSPYINNGPCRFCLGKPFSFYL